MAVAKSYKNSGFKAFDRGDTGQAHLRYAQAWETYRRLADVGHGDALFELGKLTCVGWGVAENPALARKYFERAQLSDKQLERVLIIDEFRLCMQGPSDRLATRG